MNTRFEAHITVDGQKIQHLTAQPDEDAAKAKVKRAYPGKEITFREVMPAHARLQVEYLAT